MILTISNSIEAAELIAYAKARNPAISTIARADSEEEATHLRQQGASHVVLDRRELAKSLVALLN